MFNRTRIVKIERTLNNILEYLSYHDEFLSLVKKLKKARNDDLIQYHHNIFNNKVEVVKLNGHTAPDGIKYNRWTDVYSFNDFNKYVEHELLKLELENCQKKCRKRRKK